VDAWPKEITVGNWREGGCAAQSLIHSYSFISTTVDKTQLCQKETVIGLEKKINIKSISKQSRESRDSVLKKKRKAMVGRICRKGVLSLE